MNICWVSKCKQILSFFWILRLYFSWRVAIWLIVALLYCSAIYCFVRSYSVWMYFIASDCLDLVARRVVVFAVTSSISGPVSWTKDQWNYVVMYVSNGYWEALSLRVKWQGCVADHSPPTSAEVKTMWIYTSTPPYAFMA
jgi:hypothetical protein